MKIIVIEEHKMSKEYSRCETNGNKRYLHVICAAPGTGKTTAHDMIYCGNSMRAVDLESVADLKNRPAKHPARNIFEQEAYKEYLVDRDNFSETDIYLIHHPDQMNLAIKALENMYSNLSVRLTILVGDNDAYLDTVYKQCNTDLAYESLIPHITKSVDTDVNRVIIRLEGDEKVSSILSKLYSR